MLAPKILPVTSTLDVVAAFLLAAALRKKTEQLVGPAIGLALAAYVVAVVVSQRTFDEGAPFVGAALLTSGEFAVLSIHDSSRIRIDAAIVRARVAAIALLVVSGFILAAVIASTVSLPVSRSELWTMAGGVVVLAILGLLAALEIRRIRRRTYSAP